ncbi:hypothetical protein QEJ31_01845 [Pigmentibacter sp. JX0631]|uniref:LpxL/LpxP family acyltransferase n=1 Tax=Pigmentibacter sp. JX0631 TaxID=2976982 RepID=UPI00246833AC|nr:hypothetical protein [Pigmentibacter sp. JX0631]WGL60345.1 hypothetical protein QEJ31_01845 [Pigmentibacter sp. JX0631]
MKKIKYIILLLLNILFLPLYIFFGFISFFLTFLPIFPTQTAKQNLRQQLNIKGFKSNILITQVYLNYLYYFIEAFIFQKLNLNICEFSDNFIYQDFYAELKKKYPALSEKGIVYILSHMANVEMYSLPVTEEVVKGKHNKVYALAQPAKFQWVNKLLSWYRVRPGMGVVMTDKSLFHKMEKLIQSGKASFCMLVDQKPKSGGLFIQFFNDYAAFPTSGLRMCMNQGMVIAYAAAYRVMPGVVRLKMQSGKNPHLKKNILENYQQIYAKDEYLIPAELFAKDKIKERETEVASEMAYFTKWIEEQIRQHPNQWCWDYRKWSRKPNIEA